MEILHSADVAIFYMINRDISLPFFDFIAPQISSLGTSQFVALIALVFILTGRKNLCSTALLLLAGLTLSYLVTGGMKDLISRPRPFMELADAVLRGTSSGYSFPSGHSTIAFMAAVIISHYIENKYVSFISFLAAFGIGFSRIYIGVHYPSDVICGFITGTVIAWALIIAAKSAGLRDNNPRMGREEK